MVTHAQYACYSQLNVDVDGKVLSKQQILFINMLCLGKECEAMSEAAAAVYSDHLHSPR